MEPRREEALATLAAAKTADERAAFLDRECAGDPALRQRVEQFLAQRAPVAEAPAWVGGTTNLMSAAFQETAPAENPNATIGKYRLLEKLGEGGFGAVWAAEQKEPVKRRVALKIIKLGMDTEQVVARFEAERQALAMMDHPHIARVLDAGATDAGRPYFVMELVRGVPITRFCVQERLSLRDQIELLVKVCHAVQHAHQKGIIHRDLKPSNILVAFHDGVPVPKVIDFGIAKATQAELTEKTIYTQRGQFIGTPAYMSPEQAEMSGLDIDTRSDIYSLGVVLYEMLTESTPFDTEELLRSGLDAMRKLIREREPVRPSTRLRQLTADGSSGAQAPLRPTTLASDLDWIVMKCLEKDRARRYETANALAADLTRHLGDEPVVARPPSAIYRLQKLWRRNAVLLTASGVVALALVIGIVGLSLGLRRAAEERIKAEHAAGQAIESAHDAQEARKLAEANAALLRNNLYFNSVALAHRELTSRPPNIRFAEQLLDECPDELRSWEWHHLKRRRFVEPVVLQDPGSGPVRSLSFSADNRLLALGAQDGKIRIWEPSVPKLARVLAGHEGFVVAVAFSPVNSRWIASTGSDKTLRLWDWEAARQVGSWPCATSLRDYGTSASVAFSPDGQRLAAAGAEGEVRVLRVEDGTVALSLPGHDRGIQCVAFSGDGRWLATGSAGGTVRLCDVASGHEHPALSSRSPPVAAVAFTSDSRELVALQFDGTLRRWDAGTRKELSVVSIRTSATSSTLLALALHPSADRMAATGIDSPVSVSERTTSRQLLLFREPTRSCLSLGFSPDGHRLAVGSRTGKVHVWDGTPVTERLDPALRTYQYVGREVWACDIQQGRLTIAVGGYPPETSGVRSAPVLVWRGLDDRAPLELPGHVAIVFSVAIDPSGRLLASTGDQPHRPGTADVKVWDLASGKEAYPLEPFEGDGRYFALAFSPDAKWLVAAGIDRSIRAWDAATGRRGAVLGEHANEITSLCFSADGKHLASVGNDDVVKVWEGSDLGAPRPCVRTFPAYCVGFRDSVAFSPREPRLAVVAGDDFVILHDLAADDRAVRLTYPGHHPLAVAFSPDGRRVVSGGRDCALRIWDASSGALLGSLASHVDRVVRLRFAQLPDAILLISGSLDGTVKLWDMGGY